MKLYSFLKNKLNMKFPSKIPEPIPILTVCKMSKNSDLPGAELGVPLNIFQYIATYNHYGYSIVNPELIVLQFLIGFYTYGKDRYYDAIAANETGIGYQSKKDLYDYILKNKLILKILIDLSFISIVSIILVSNSGISVDKITDLNSAVDLLSNMHIGEKLPFIGALLRTEY